MQEIFFDALIDSAAMVPLLLIIYISIELIEYKFGNKIKEKVQKAGPAGPVIGAIAGIFPQCGFSVITTALYTQRLVTIGTLLAVYLATSDEAIPVILSQPGQSNVVFLLVLTKILIALTFGYAIDFLFRGSNRGTLAHIEACDKGRDDRGHHHEIVLEEPACCGHRVSATAKKFKAEEILLHPVIHTAKIFLFVFLTTVAVNLAVSRIGQDALAKFFLDNRVWQPFFTALIGLIPSCAVSVAITEFYLKGIITYGAAISGLCAGAGLGILVLLREEKNKKKVIQIISLLFGISVVSGLAIQYWVKF